MATDRPDNFFRTRWQFDEQIKAAGIALLVGLPVVLLVTSALGQPAAISPFITSYLDVLDENSQWAVPYLNNHRGMSLVFAAAFIITLTTSLFLLYAISVGSEKVNGIRTFRWPDFGRGFSGRISMAACFVVMLISNLMMFGYYDDALEAGSAYFRDETTFRLWYRVALSSRIVCVVAALSAFLKVFFADFASGTFGFRRKYLSYFYPSLLSIAVVAFIFTQMDQFDSLFVALIRDPANFFVFTVLLFPVSLIIVWFIPSYLNFTDVQYSERNKAWRIMTSILGHKLTNSHRTYRWLYSHKRLFNGSVVPPEDQRAPDHFLADRTERIPYPPALFYTVATFLGLLFVITLISVCLDIFDRTLPGDWLPSTLIMSVIFLLVVAYWIWCGSVLRSARRPENIAIRKLPRRDYRRENPLTDWWHNLADRQAPEGITPGSRAARRKKFYYVANRKPFLFGMMMFVLMVALLIVMLGLVTVGTNWEATYLVYLAFLFVTPFVFIWLAVFQDFHPYYTFDKTSRRGKDYDGDTILTGEPTITERRMDLFDAFTTQVMLAFVFLVALLSGFLFIIGLFTSGWLSSPSLQRINPLNLYLILVNGAIALIVLADRFINLRNFNRQYYHLRRQLNARREQARLAKLHQTVLPQKVTPLQPDKRVETPYLFWGFAVVLIWLATTYIGNSYHEVSYGPVTQTEASRQLSLDQYTERFLAARPDSTQPIIFIGADGGGLKACYWTLRVLHHLDSVSLANGERGFYNDRVFLTSGASGGSIGLSMYTLLKARWGDDLPLIRQRIETIGATNFLSGDFAGLLTRFPLNYLPEQLVEDGPRRFQDRAEAMAEAYLDIVFAPRTDEGYRLLKKEPYWHLWAEADYRMPLFVANTARGEDGVRGVVYPLVHEDALTPGVLDLGRNRNGAISFPGAAFLSNRFPLMSPPARIIGKGHFLDAGSADNSGLATIYDFLRYMKAAATVDTSRLSSDPAVRMATLDRARMYQRFLDRKIVVVSVRNALSRFVRDEFLPVLDSINRFYYQPDLTASTAAAVNSGIAGVPIAWDEYLRSSAPRELGVLDTFVTVNLPFRLRDNYVFQSLGGELRDTTLHRRVAEINHAIHGPLGEDSTFILAPPLGRLLAAPSRRYMGDMLRYPANAASFKYLLRNGRKR